MDTLLTIHGELRWLVVLVGAAALIRYLAGWLGGAAFGKPDRILSAAFNGLMGLNLLLGLVLFVGHGDGITAARIEHVTTMFIAVIVAHGTIRWRKLKETRTVFMAHALTVAAVLGLVVVGVLRLRGGWIFS